jgi:hypothetical protein
LRQLCQLAWRANGPEYHLVDISPSHKDPLNLEKQQVQAKGVKEEAVAKTR